MSALFQSEVSPAGQQSARAAGLGGVRCEQCRRPMRERAGKHFCGGACRAAASRARAAEKMRRMENLIDELAQLRCR
jgi:hypothetical protein